MGPLDKVHTLAMEAVIISTADIRTCVLVDFPRERVPVVLAPLLYQQETDITEDRLVSSVVTQASSVSTLCLAVGDRRM